MKVSIFFFFLLTYTRKERKKHLDVAGIVPGSFSIPNKPLVPLHHCSRYCKLFLEMPWFLSCGYSSAIFVPKCSERISNWPWDVGRFKVPQFFSLLSIEFTRPLPNRECWCSTPCSINLSLGCLKSASQRTSPPRSWPSLTKNVCYTWCVSVKGHLLTQSE